MTLKVIGAGFGRTGTLSLKTALEQLGFIKCHHMKEVPGSLRQLQAWHTLSHGGVVDWDDVFDGFQASCDWPSCTYWEQLARHYPDSKIILTVRDADRWYDSAAETIYPVTKLIPVWLRRLVPRIRMQREMIYAGIWDGTFGGRFEDRDHAIQVYRDHIDHVTRTADPERLLVFEARQGWEPICKFLGVPVPQTAYPHVNEAAVIKRVVRALKILRWLPLALALLLLGALALQIR